MVFSLPYYPFTDSPTGKLLALMVQEKLRPKYSQFDIKKSKMEKTAKCPYFRLELLGLKRLENGQNGLHMSDHA